MCFDISPLPLKSSLYQIIVIFNIFLHIYYNEINLIIGIVYYSGACIGQQIRKVCRCQKGYRKSYIEEGQAMQWPNEKGQNDKQWSTKMKIEQHESHLKPDGTLSVTT